MPVTGADVLELAILVATLHEPHVLIIMCAVLLRWSALDLKSPVKAAGTRMLILP